MVLVIMFFSILSGYIFKAYTKKWYNPVTVFCILWGGIFFLYSLNLVDYFEITDVTQFAFLLQMIGFVLGGISACRYMTSVSKKTGNSYYEKTTLNYKLMYTLCIITIFVLYQESISVIKGLLNGMSLYDMVGEDIIQENTATGIMVLIKIFIVFPITYGISAITASELFGNSQRNRKVKLLLVFNIAIVLLYALQHGGRHCIIIFVCSYICAYYMNKGNADPNKKNGKWILLLTLIAILFSVFLSNSRGISNDRLLMSLYKYFVGCIPNLSYWINKLGDSLEHTYGFSSINGFLSPVIILLRGVGILGATPYLSKLAGQYIALPENVSQLGQGIGFNAFVSPAYSFYVDGGLIGVLIGSFVYGYICMNLFNIFMRMHFTKHSAIYAILFTTLIMSFTKFQFSQYFYSMALVMCFVVYKREKKDDNIKS